MARSLRLRDLLRRRDGREPSTVDNGWYDRLGDGWWDAGGPVAALHELTPLRADYYGTLLLAHAAEGRPPRVLDLGCGGGLLAEALVARGSTVLGIDRSRPSLEAAERHRRAASAPLGGSPRYLEGDAERLPLADGSVDAVVCAELLEHVDAPGPVLAEAARVLRPGGLLLFDTPNRTPYARVGLIWLAAWLRWTPRHAHRYGRLLRPEELTALCAHAGLELRELRGVSLARPGPRALWGYLRRRRLGGFRLSEDRRLLYIGHAVRGG